MPLSRRFASIWISPGTACVWAPATILISTRVGTVLQLKLLALSAWRTCVCCAAVPPMIV